MLCVLFLCPSYPQSVLWETYFQDLFPRFVSQKFQLTLPYNSSLFSFFYKTSSLLAVLVHGIISILLQNHLSFYLHITIWPERKYAPAFYSKITIWPEWKYSPVFYSNITIWPVRKYAPVFNSQITIWPDTK